VSRALRTYEWLSRTGGSEGKIYDGTHDSVPARVIARGRGRKPGASSCTRKRPSVFLSKRGSRMWMMMWQALSPGRPYLAVTHRLRRPPQRGAWVWGLTLVHV